MCFVLFIKEQKSIESVQLFLKFIEIMMCLVLGGANKNNGVTRGCPSCNAIKCQFLSSAGAHCWSEASTASSVGSFLSTFALK